MPVNYKKYPSDWKGQHRGYAAAFLHHSEGTHHAKIFDWRRFYLNRHDDFGLEVIEQ